MSNKAEATWHPHDAPTPELVTDEQRAAWQRVIGKPVLPIPEGTTLESDLALLAPLLPSELTNPQPELPTEPGAYHDARGTLTVIDPRGKWHGTYGDLINPDICPGPFTRLVPERPQVTVEQVVEIMNNLDEGWTASAEKVVALVNGDPR
jgi:hypothetical protein